MKIICIGRNYIEHAKELNNPLPESPVFFLKPDTALLQNSQPFMYPDFTSDLHYETELVLKICASGKAIPENEASNYYREIGIGIDFTARDLQQRCKEKGLPWEIAKGFDHSAPLSDTFIEKDKLANRHAIKFHLNINGTPVQQGNSANMIFSFEKIISYVSRFITLSDGDLVFTGTPAGVGPVRKGDHLEAFIEGRKLLSFSVQ